MHNTRAHTERQHDGVDSSLGAWEGLFPPGAAHIHMMWRESIRSLTFWRAELHHTYHTWSRLAGP